MKKKTNNFSTLNNTASQLLILKALNSSHSSTPNEILEIISQNGITGFSYGTINRILALLLEDGYISKTSAGEYSLTAEGLRKASHDHDFLEQLFQLILHLNPDIILEGRNHHKADPELLSVYRDCPAIKIVPCTIESFSNCDEDNYFLKELPENDYVFEFNSKGIGNSVSGTLIAFRSNGLIKFIGILESYDAMKFTDDGHRYMILKKGTVRKLTVPVTEDDIRNYIDSDFHFIRNKQAFTGKAKISGFLSLLESRL